MPSCPEDVDESAHEEFLFGSVTARRCLYCMHAVFGATAEDMRQHIYEVHNRRRFAQGAPVGQ